MKKCFWRINLVVIAAGLLAGCGNRETKQALDKATAQEGQKQYQDANTTLVEALRARETKIREGTGTPADNAGVEALNKTVQSDTEILKLERAQIPIYLHLERADLASAVYSDILAGSPGDPVVTDTLHDTDPKMRTGAARVLGLAGKPDGIPALAAALKDPDQDVRRAAVAALGTIKYPGAVPPLLDALKDSYWFVRSEAAEALGQQHDLRAIRPLLDAAADPDATVQSAAQSSLFLLAREKGASGDDFADRLSDSNPRLVLISAVCLAIIKDPRAIPILLQLSDAADLPTRLEAIKALGDTENPLVIPKLHLMLKDPDINVRGWSIIGLGKLKDQTALPDLRAIVANPQESPKIQAAAEASIAHIQGPAATPGTP